MGSSACHHLTTHFSPGSLRLFLPREKKIIQTQFIQLFLADSILMGITFNGMYLFMI